MITIIIGLLILLVFSFLYPGLSRRTCSHSIYIFLPANLKHTMSNNQDYASTCPENLNSTDCLLRLVIATLEKPETFTFNWDPISFGFSVSVGILATIFAIFASYQAILASTDGRRKSSHTAIGEWADLTTHQWSWRDLNRLSIAVTPILRAKRVMRSIDFHTQPTQPTQLTREPEPEPKSLLAWLWAAFWKVEKLLKRSPPAATWLLFLEHMSLSELVLRDCTSTVKRNLVGKKLVSKELVGKSPMMQPTMADYLPSDLVSVRAYAEVGFIVAAAAAAGGIHTLDFGRDRFPALAGDGAQVDFRDHPMLGTFAAFTNYGAPTTATRNPTNSVKMLRRISRAISHSYSDVDIHGSHKKMRCTKTQRINQARE